MICNGSSWTLTRHLEHFRKFSVSVCLIFVVVSWDYAIPNLTCKKLSLRCMVTTTSSIAKWKNHSSSLIHSYKVYVVFFFFLNCVGFNSHIVGRSLLFLLQNKIINEATALTFILPGQLWPVYQHSTLFLPYLGDLTHLSYLFLNNSRVFLYWFFWLLEYTRW